MNQNFSNFLLEKSNKFSENYSLNDWLIDSSIFFNLENIFIIKKNKEGFFSLEAQGYSNDCFKINSKLQLNTGDLKKTEKEFLSQPISIKEKDNIYKKYNFNPKMFYLNNNFIFGFSGKNISLNYNLFLKQISLIFYSKISKENHINKHIEDSTIKLKEEFLSKISHEIRTPLNSIIGNTKNLKNIHPENKLINQIEESSNKLLKIINNLLDFNSMEQKKQIIKNENFNIDELLCECFSYFESEVDFSFRRTTDQVDIFNDKNKIKQVVMSILDNSNKFKKEDIPVKVKVNVYQLNNEIFISFKDNGIGINPDVNVFKDFTQEDNSSTREHQGIGLELTICKKLMKQLSGNIIVNSEGKNLGSEFIINFPISAIIESSETKNFNAHVLIVEDDSINQDVAKNYLKNIGISSDIAENGQVALNLVKENPHKYQLILMDCQMPIMDGYQCTKHLRKMNYLYPISAFTAHAYQEDKERCLNSGMDYFITKPIEDIPFNAMLMKLLPMSFDNLNHKSLEQYLNQPQGRDFLSSLIEKFVANLINKDLKIIRSLLNKKDFVPLAKTFHRLKSTFGTFGFIKTQNLLKEYQKLEKFSETEYIIFRNHLKSDIIALNKWCTENNVATTIKETLYETI